MMMIESVGVQTSAFRENVRKNGYKKLGESLYIDRVGEAETRTENKLSHYEMLVSDPAIMVD